MAGLEQDSALQGKQEETEFSRAKRELQLWKTKVEVEEDNKGRLIVKRLEEEQEKKKNHKLMMELMQKHDGVKREALQSSKSLQVNLAEIRRRKMELMDNLKKVKAKLQQTRAETHRLQHKFKICAELPDKDVEFVKPKQDNDDDVSSDEPIRGQFSVCQEGALQLKAGQALITFEEERVVSQLLRTDRCSVSLEDQTVEVKPKRIRTEPLVQFEIQLCVSRLVVDVADVVSSMPVERVEDRVELAFCRPSRGGAEIRSVEFNPRDAKARVTFIKPGAAEWLALREHTVDLDFPTVVKVAPVYEHQLHKFQSFCGAPKRTLLLDDIRDTGDDDEEVQDQLEIHFQKPSNGGGEIEHTLYTSSGRAAFFSPDN